MDWEPPQKPAELTEQRIITAILNGQFPINSTLPGERDLALKLGVTRPTLREALQRLSRDGWLEIHQGKPTRVRNYWEEGSLAVLSALVHHQQVSQNFINNLLTIRLLLAPTYARLAIENNSEIVSDLLESAYLSLPDTPENFTDADWILHRTLTTNSPNPIFSLILNGFKELYIEMGLKYFSNSAARNYSQQFYLELFNCAVSKDGQGAEKLTGDVMKKSLEFWQEVEKTDFGGTK